MSERRSGYLVAVALLTLLTSIPQGILCQQIWLSYYAGLPLVPHIPGVTQGSVSYSRFSYCDLWRHHLVHVTPDMERMKAKKFTNGVVIDWRVSLFDPETGEETSMENSELVGDGFRVVALGDRLFFCGRKQQFELVDGSLKATNFRFGWNRPNSALQGAYFQIDGEIAEIQKRHGSLDFVVTLCNSGDSSEEWEVVLPKKWVFGNTIIDSPTTAELTCFNYGDRIYSFLRVDGRLLHRQGLNLRKVGGGIETRLVGGVITATGQDELVGWSLIREELGTPASWRHQYGTIVDGKPGALIVDNVESGSPIGSLHKFDGTAWSQAAILPFPFGSDCFRVLARDDQSPYIVVTTSTGTGFTYVAEPGRIRTVGGQGWANTWFYVKREVNVRAIPVAVMMGLGLLPGIGLWILMAWCTEPQYGFGIQSIRLASLGRRGLARLIDIVIIASTTVMLGWTMFQGFDWLSLAEATHLKLDHPTIGNAIRMLQLIAGWLTVQIIALITIEGFWGLTLGKWICGLRTIRTTLRPCGVARSLVREFVLLLESCYLLCWLPGIVSIAVTRNRQRLGDLIADTIVVEARSLTTAGQTSPPFFNATLAKDI